MGSSNCFKTRYKCDQGQYYFYSDQWIVKMAKILYAVVIMAIFQPPKVTSIWSFRDCSKFLPHALVLLKKYKLNEN